MKFSETIWLMIILKVTKTQGFTLSLEDTFSEKPQEGSNDPSPHLPPPPPIRPLPPPAVLGLIFLNLLDEKYSKLNLQ